MDQKCGRNYHLSNPIWSAWNIKEDNESMQVFCLILENENMGKNVSIVDRWSVVNIRLEPPSHASCKMLVQYSPLSQTQKHL